MRFAELQSLRKKRGRLRILFSPGFWRTAWWSFVKAMWLATLNGMMFIFALREKQTFFAILILVLGAVIIYKEITDE